ncbi:MAG: radical SAM protein [Megasphaera sp.]|nr:radical SAM protein [Megasphaera sp.]MCH4218502.1 radical SAM protein [Megasphaera sp.]
MSWQIEKLLSERLEAESGYYQYPFGSRRAMAICYPNTYEVAMSNLGLQIIYKEVNDRDDWLCERAFLPDKELAKLYDRSRTPLLTLENRRPLCDFEIIGLSVSFEMDYFNIPDLLRRGHVPVLASQRGETDPIVAMGGPVAFFNPEPLTPFVDVVMVGEGEKLIHHFLDAYDKGRQAGLSRHDILRSLAEVPGLYIPSLYRHDYDDQGRLCRIVPLDGAPARVERQWNELDGPGETVVATPYTEFGAMYLIEIARGCGRHCRFCMAGYCYRRPRVRPLAYVKEAVLRGKKLGKKIGLMGAAISDYPYIDELVQFIRSEGLAFSCASLRADSITPAIVQGLAESGQKTITLAPEAGSIHMRDIINKGITEEHLLHSIDLATAAGIRHVRMYIMIGLPMETDEDIQGIVAMTRRVQQHMASIGNMSRITLSINPFIPKPFTPFQWMAMCDKKVVEKRLAYIKKELGRDKQIELLAEPLRQCYIQGVLSRGGRRVGEVLALACQYGGVKGWKRAVKELHFDSKQSLYTERPTDAVLPWSVLDSGLAPTYLVHELEQARKGAFTIPCFPGCRRCHVCGGTHEHKLD